MKKYIISLFIIVALRCVSVAQNDTTYDAGYCYSKWDWVNLKSKRDAHQVGIQSALMFVSGMGRGMEQVLVYHYDAFHTRHPSANPLYWNPKYSWTNKYKHHNPYAGPKFLFSTNALVWLTDGKHLMDAINNVPIYVTITLPIAYPSYKVHKPRNIIGRTLMLSIYRQAGFYLMYNILYNG